MAKIRQHESALELRKRGDSVNSIAKKLAVSKSTVSMWCKDMILTDTQMAKIAGRSKHNATLALLKSAEKRRLSRIENIKRANYEGASAVGALSKRDLFMVGLGLYWGEGYKRGSQELGFTNSDPAMITFYIYWLKRIYGIKPADLILRVSVNDTHTYRIKEIEVYWSKLTGISISQFTKSSLIKTTSKKIYQSPTQHYGTLRVKVRRGTELRRKILGSIAKLKVSMTR